MTDVSVSVPADANLNINSTTASSNCGCLGEMSFFEMLAKVFGDIAEELETDMRDKGEALQDAGAGDDNQFARAQSEFNAAVQEFTMFMETINTVLQQIGQAAQSQVRAQ